MTRVAIPAILVMIAVAGFVAAAGWNRSGEPQLVITLTERELALPYRAVPPGDDPGLSLGIAYEARYDPLDSRNWLPEARLREIGFPFHVPVGAPQAVDAYDSVPPRLAWVVFEHDGPQWRDLERRRELLAAERPANGMVRRTMTSRLVPVDAGADFDALRRRYPSGHLIMRAVIGLTYVGAPDGGPMVHGVLRELVPHRVAVPHQFKPLFEGLTSPIQSGATEPRYEAELALGALGLPYIRAVRLRQ
jgi:hypothetical protein